MKKIMSIILIMSLSLVTINPFMHTTYASDMTSIEVIDVGNGSYKLTTNKDVKLNKTNSNYQINKIIKLDDMFYQLESTNLAKNEKLIKVNTDTFQKVTEFNIDINNNYEVNFIIENYDISSKLKEDLRCLAEQQNENIEVKVYLPLVDKFSNKQENSVLNTTVYNYVGYAGYNYRDEVIVIDNITPFQDVKTGSTIKNFFSTNLNDIGSIALSSLPNIVGVTYTLVGIINNLQTNYSYGSQDSWQASKHEEKMRKYTSIYYNYLGYEGWYFRALSDKGDNKFEHRIVINSSYPSQYKYGFSQLKTYTLPNFYSTDQKAYEYRNYPTGYHHGEVIDKWRVNNLTTFNSILQ